MKLAFWLLAALILLALAIDTYAAAIRLIRTICNAP